MGCTHSSFQQPFRWNKWRKKQHTNRYEWSTDQFQVEKNTIHRKLKHALSNLWSVVQSQTSSFSSSFPSASVSASLLCLCLYLCLSFPFLSFPFLSFPFLSFPFLLSSFPPFLSSFPSWHSSLFSVILYFIDSYPSVFFCCLFWSASWWKRHLPKRRKFSFVEPFTTHPLELDLLRLPSTCVNAVLLAAFEAFNVQSKIVVVRYNFF